MKKIANAIRTKIDTTVENALAISIFAEGFLKPDEDIISVSIVPDNANTVLIAGTEDDDYINIGEGIVLNIDFRDADTKLPFIKSAAGVVTVNYIVAIKRR